MPFSPSTTVMALEQKAVAVNPGSWNQIPGSSFCHSAASTPPWAIGISSWLPVRLSMMVMLSATTLGSSCWGCGSDPMAGGAGGHSGRSAPMPWRRAGRGGWSNRRRWSSRGRGGGHRHDRDLAGPGGGTGAARGRGDDDELVAVALVHGEGPDDHGRRPAGVEDDGGGLRGTDPADHRFPGDDD